MESGFGTSTPGHRRRPFSASVGNSSIVKPKLSSPVKLAYRDKRPVSSYLTRPSNKVTCAAPNTDVSLGPGKYNVSSQSVSMSCSFSHSERFDNTDFFAKLFIFKKITDSDKEQIAKRIEKNKEEAIKTKEKKREETQSKIQKINYRANVIKLTKRMLSQEKQMMRAENLKEKYRKYEYRMKIDVRFN
jgi:hypothetical protein